MLECGAKILENFCYARSTILEAIHVQPCINTSTVVKKGNRDTKEDKGKSMMHALYNYCGWRKGTSQAKAMSNGEKNQPVAVAIVELHWSQAVSQLVSQ